MPIERAPRPDKNFYILDKQISEDSRLSWAARGLLIFLLGKPDHWQISIANLINETGDSIRRGGHTKRDGVLSLVRELEEAGYVEKLGRVRASGGRLGEYQYIVREQGKPKPDDPVQVVSVRPDQTQEAPHATDDPYCVADYESPKPAEAVLVPPKPDEPTQVQPTQAHPELVSTELKQVLNLSEWGTPPAKQPMTEEWEPDSEILQAVCLGMLVPIEKITAVVLFEFRNYWLDTNRLETERGWISGLVRRVAEGKAINSGSRSANDQRGFVEKHTNTDWREGL